jgi:lycopene beta-cyclase
MIPKLFDFAIVGTGAAGLQLALSMLEDSFFQDKQVLLIDKEEKVSNDHTWCYWEKGSGRYDHLLYKSWERGLFLSSTAQIELNLKPYRYKMLRSGDFYAYAKQKIESASNFTRIQAEVLHLKEGENVQVETGIGVFSARHVFDSRIDPAFATDKKSTKILQHFKGWMIESEAPVFHPEQFVMMDYRLRKAGTSSFIYVLPSTPHRALVEFTLFTPDLIQEEEYDEILKKYMSAIPGIGNYTITETEMGIIPMSDYPFHKHHTQRITKIGTAGGWVKPSSGYSFYNGKKYAERIVAAIKSGQSPSFTLTKPRFRFYDRIFLDVLFHQNERGEEIFTSMYSKNKVTDIFRFLDEETSLAEELRIINRFPHAPFLRAVMNRYFRL